MRTSPTRLTGGLEVIFLGGLYYYMDTPADYTNATGALHTFLDNRTRNEGVDTELRRREDLERQRLTQKAAPVVSVQQMRLAAFAQGRLALLDSYMAALPDGEFKIRWQCNDTNFTRADLNTLVPGTLTAGQADGLFNAARLV